MDQSTRAALLAEGVPAAAIDYRLRSGRWSAPVRGIYVPSPVPTFGQRCAAALDTQVDAALSHDTAVLLHGWKTLRPVDADRIHLTVGATATTSQRRGIRLHRTVAPPQLVTIGGHPVTSPARTVVDMARQLPSLHATVLADSALRDRLLTPEHLAAQLTVFEGFRNIDRARQAIARAQPGTRSVPETQLRLIALDAGLDGVQAGYQIRNEYGELLVEADAADENVMIWLEYDGFEVHSERRQFRRDRGRALWLKDRGWDVAAITDEQLRHSGFLTAVVASMIQRAPRRLEALPWGLSPEADAAKRRLARPPAA
jgi:hypothetical protein